MGSEYAIIHGTISETELEQTLRGLPHYCGRTEYKGNLSIEFRGPNTLKDPNSMPDVSVSIVGDQVIVCQYGDYTITATVLGALAMELVSESEGERIEIVKP